MLPIKFRLNPTFSLGGDAITWIMEWNNFSNSESLCHPNTSHQVLDSIQLTIWEKMLFEQFQDGQPWWPPWISVRNGFSNSESLSWSDDSHQVFAQSNLRFGRRCHFKSFKMAAVTALLDIRTERF